MSEDNKMVIWEFNMQFKEVIPDGVTFHFPRNYTTHFPTPHMAEVTSICLYKAKTVPKSFIPPDWLNNLYMHVLEELPSGFILPKELKKLSMPKIEVLPSDFNLPYGLHTLILNNLKTLPSECSLPDSIKHLEVNSLTSFPKGFKLPKDLEFLYVNNVNILNEMELPDSLSKIECHAISVLQNKFICGGYWMTYDLKRINKESE